MSSGQIRTLILILILLALAVARSQNVRSFFSQAMSAASGSLSSVGSAAGTQKPAAPAPAVTLDWHLFLWWGGASIAALLLSDAAPNVVDAFLALLIVEELLVNWHTYAAFLQPPTK